MPSRVKRGGGWGRLSSCIPLAGVEKQDGLQRVEYRRSDCIVAAGRMGVLGRPNHCRRDHLVFRQALGSRIASETIELFGDQPRAPGASGIRQRMNGFEAAR